MKNYAVIDGKRLELTPLEVIRIVATHAGFDDVDVEPFGDRPGYAVSAWREKGSPSTVTGPSLIECAKRFVQRHLT